MEALFVYIVGILILYVILILKAIIEFKLMSQNPYILSQMAFLI